MRTAALAIGTLTLRELRRFYRQPSRIIGSLGSPILFWFLLGSGLKAAFPAASSSSGRDFMQYFFPGNLCLTILFTSIFSNISLIEDRNEGFLQSVLVAPVPRLYILLGKIFGGTLITVFQGLLFLALAPAAHIPLTAYSVLLCAASIFAMGFALTTLGFFFAWKLDSVQGFHSIMNLVLIPMWILSGAFFPLEGAPAWLKPVMWVNPVTYGVASLQSALVSGRGTVTLASWFPSLLITLGYGIVFLMLTLIVVRTSASGSRKVSV